MIEYILRTAQSVDSDVSFHLKILNMLLNKSFVSSVIKFGADGFVGFGRAIATVIFIKSFFLILSSQNWFVIAKEQFSS